MRLYDIVRTYIQKFIASEELYSLEGTFTNVRESKALTDFIPLEGATVYNVKLNVVQSTNSGLTLVPAENSKGIITFSSKVTAFVAMVGQIDKYILNVGGSIITYGEAEIKLNEGKNGGLINVSDLVSKLNTLESEVNELKLLFTTWIPAFGDGGTVLKALITAWAAQPLTPTTIKEIEDETVIH